MGMPKDPEKFKEWLSHQTPKTQRKWSKPGAIEAHFKRCGHPMPKGPDSPNWVGDAIKYNSLHLWLRKTIPKPDCCTHCGEPVERLELANINGIYNRDPNNYIWICTTCHRKMDGHSYKKMKTKTRHGLFFNQYYQEYSALLV